MNSIINIEPLSFPWQTSDPFLFCAYHKDSYPEGNNEFGPNASLEERNLGQDFESKDGWNMYHGVRVPGFPAHPHRGFETVTIAQEGTVDHSDSLGAAGRFSNGDVQWMTAGKGVQHCEMFPLLDPNKNNPLELFQIWLNLPKASKMVEPHFAMLWNEDIKRHELSDSSGKKTEIKMVTGSFEEFSPINTAPDSWAADSSNEVAIWTIIIEPGAEFKLPVASKGINRSLYYHEGQTLSIDNTPVSINHMVELHADQSTIIKNGNSASKLLMLQGKPIGEPVAQYGPFVMNEQSEIMEAMQDYRETEFGGWPWPEHDHVHPKERGRFAKHADGSEETP